MNAQKELTLHVVCDYTRLRYILFFSGDTSQKEDAIKELGYKFVMPPMVIQQFNLDPKLLWCKATTIDEKDLEIVKTLALNPLMIDHTSDGDLLLLEGCQELANEQHFIVRTEIPEQPDIIAGRYWNHKFYGRPGNWSIYQDGERVQISDSEKSILDWYIKRLIDFESKVETGWDD